MLKDSDACLLPRSTFIAHASYTGKRLAWSHRAYLASSSTITPAMPFVIPSSKACRAGTYDYIQLLISLSIYFLGFN